MHFLLWELSLSFYLFIFSLSFYIFHRHRVCLVDHVDLICRLYNWWECLGFSSLATLPLGFNCGLISISACGSSTGFQLWSYFRASLHVGHPLHVGRPLLRLPWRTLICPVSARCGGGAAAGVLAAPVTEESWWLEHQEIQCSRRVWQPVLVNMLQFLPGEPPRQRSLADHSPQGRTEPETTKATLHT